MPVKHHTKARSAHLSVFLASDNRGSAVRRGTVERPLRGRLLNVRFFRKLATGAVGLSTIFDARRPDPWAGKVEELGSHGRF